MPARWGLGPVFALEWLLASRRWQMYAVRALVVSAFLDALLLVWEWTSRDIFKLNAQPLSYRDYGRIGERFYGAVVVTQLTLILLIAPATTAGAVCLDRLRGTLSHMLVTDLSGLEIVLGKLAARLIPVLSLIVCSAPVLMISTLLGGMDPYAVVAAYAVMFGVGTLGAALALLLSVWGRKPHEVLLVVYVMEMFWILAYHLYAAADALLFQTGFSPNWLLDLNPYSLALAPSTRPTSVDWWDYGQFLLATGGAAAVCTLLAAASVRAVTLRHGTVIQRPPTAASWLRRRGPTLDRNPLLWYEWRRQRPSRWACIVWTLYGICAVSGCLVVLNTWPWGRVFGLLSGEGAIIVNTLAPAFGLLLASVAAMTAFAEDRVRSNLDELLAAPLPTRAIVWAKWRTAFRPIPWVVALSAAFSAALVVRGGGGWMFVGLMAALILGCGAFVTSLGLALALWVPRVGRALAYGVGLYAFQCLGWPIAALLMFDGPNGGLDFGPTLVSPLFAGGVLTSALHPYSGRGIDAGRLLAWSLGWIGVLSAASAVLYWLTVATFDRCMGRVPEGGMRRGRPREEKAKTPLRRDPIALSPTRQRG